MSGLLYLTSEDFFPQKGPTGDILCQSVPGFSLILFYSVHCQHCEALLPIFKRLTGSLGGCQFGIVNIGKNKRCVEMSSRTQTPIRYVPYIVLYIDGKPFMAYKGPYDHDEIKRFVIDVLSKLQQKQQFSKEVVKENPETGIPAYTIGHPVTGDKNQLVCYLSFEQFMDGPTQVPAPIGAAPPQQQQYRAAPPQQQQYRAAPPQQYGYPS